MFTNYDARQVGGLSKQAVTTLRHYTLLVATGLKDAYLVDCCMPSVSYTVSFINSLCHAYNINTVLIFILSIRTDILIINTAVLRHKLVDEVSCKQDSIVINLESGISSVMDSSRFVEEFWGWFLSTMREALNPVLGGHTPDGAFHIPRVQLVDLSGNEELKDRAGFPFVAGWLLGYPCIYRSIMNQDQSTSSDALSMQSLNKLSINLKAIFIQPPVALAISRSQHNKLSSRNLIQENSSATSASNNGSFATPAINIELISFSVPSLIMEESEGIKAMIYQRLHSLEQRINTFQQKRMSSAESGSSYGLITVESYEQTSTVCTVPSIVL